MPFQAYTAFGTQIRVGDGLSPQTFYIIGGVGNITGPATAVAEKETTAHSSGVPHRTFLPTLIDDGTLAFPVFWNLNDATHASVNSGGAPNTYSLEYLFQNRVVRAFKISGTDPSQTTRQFQGYVQKLGEQYAVDGVVTRDIVIRIVGAPSVVAY